MGCGHASDETDATDTNKKVESLLTTHLTLYSKVQSLGGISTCWKPSYRMLTQIYNILHAWGKFLVKRTQTRKESTITRRKPSIGYRTTSTKGSRRWGSSTSDNRAFRCQMCQRSTWESRISLLNRKRVIAELIKSITRRKLGQASKVLNDDDARLMLIDQKVSIKNIFGKGGNGEVFLSKNREKLWIRSSLNLMSRLSSGFRAQFPDCEIEEIKKSYSRNFGIPNYLQFVIWIPRL